MTLFDYDPDTVLFPIGQVIEGALVAGDGPEFQVVRPSDAKVATVCRAASEKNVDDAVSAASRAFDSGVWRRTSPRAKARVFRRWADLMDQHRERLATLESVVSSRPFSEAKARDVPYSAEMLRYYGELIDKTDGRVLASESHALNLAVHEPYGVVAAITPWNVPLVLAMAKIAPALAAGNAMVLKPSEQTPFSISLVALLAIEAGLPPSQFNVVHGDGPTVGTALVTHRKVAAVSFTGSTAAGRSVMAAAAMAGPKPVSLELGGKSPLVVFADAPDLEAVAQTVADSICRNGGQICHAGTRLVVDRKIADELVGLVVAKMRLRRVAGETWNPAANLAPIVSRRQLQRIEKIVADGVARGSRTLLGGARMAAELGGCFFEPTVMTSTGADCPLVREEIFGPVLCVEHFDRDEQALALAQHPEFGLVASVHTGNIDRALRMSSRIDAGTVWINHHGPTDLTAPFGGFKGSGFGKDFGTDALLKFSRTKNVWINARWTA